MPRLSFTLRDVLWLALVIGMALGWWVYDKRISASQRKSENTVAALTTMLEECGWKLTWQDDGPFRLTGERDDGELYFQPRTHDFCGRLLIYSVPPILPVVAGAFTAVGQWILRTSADTTLGDRLEAGAVFQAITAPAFLFARIPARRARTNAPGPIRRGGSFFCACFV